MKLPPVLIQPFNIFAHFKRKLLFTFRLTDAKIVQVMYIQSLKAL